MAAWIVIKICITSIKKMIMTPVFEFLFKMNLSIAVWVESGVVPSSLNTFFFFSVSLLLSVMLSLDGSVPHLAR